VGETVGQVIAIIIQIIIQTTMPHLHHPRPHQTVADSLLHFFLQVQQLIILTRLQCQQMHHSTSKLRHLVVDLIEARLSNLKFGEKSFFEFKFKTKHTP